HPGVAERCAVARLPVDGILWAVLLGVDRHHVNFATLMSQRRIALHRRGGARCRRSPIRKPVTDGCETAYLPLPAEKSGDERDIDVLQFELRQGACPPVGRIAAGIER